MYLFFSMMAVIPGAALMSKSRVHFSQPFVLFREEGILSHYNTNCASRILQTRTFLQKTPVSHSGRQGVFVYHFSSTTVTPLSPSP